MIILTGGSFQNVAGVAVTNGTLRLELSQEAKVIVGGQVIPTLLDIPLNASGSITTNTSVYGNDELTPSGTTYRATVFDSNGARVYGPQTWSLTGGGTLNVGSLIPISTSP